MDKEYYIKKRNWKQIFDFMKGIKGMHSKAVWKKFIGTPSSVVRKINNSVYFKKNLWCPTLILLPNLKRNGYDLVLSKLRI